MIMKIRITLAIVVLISFSIGIACNTSTSDWDEVRELREWVHENVDMGTICIHKNTPPNWYNDVFWPASSTTMFEMFKNDVAVVMCQGAAFALSELYRDKGFESYIVGIGIPSAVTHALTLVRIEHNGQSILTVQDTMFDLTYTYPNGEPYDYFDLLRTLKDYKHDQVVAERGNAGLQDFIACASDDIAKRELDFNTKAEQLPDGRWKFRWHGPSDDWIAPRVEAPLLADGHPGDPIYLFLYLLYVLNDYDADYGVGGLRPNTLLEQEARAILNAS